MSSAPLDEHDTLPPSMDPAQGAVVGKAPPTTTWGIIGQLGPGLIIAGSIVGSGELVATTKVGAQAGITLLWLIIVGCLIKVFVQIELGRFALTHGETTLAALDQVPGPRLKVNWILWFWLGMMACSLGQLGGIVGGVGQAMALSCPFSGDYLHATSLPSEKQLRSLLEWESKPESELTEQELRGKQRLRESLTVQGSRGEQALQLIHELEQREQELAQASADKEASAESLQAAKSARDQAKSGLKNVISPFTYDDRIWATIIAIMTSFLLYRGTYGIIQTVSTVLVVGFTFVTIGNVLALQSTEQWYISGAEIWHGLQFHLPEGNQALVTALATFGIIGVGAAELVQYPYWCLEKGYAKFTGKWSADESWATRARGWLRVMHWDAWCSMAVYTTATLAFYLMGVAVLHNDGRDPEGMRMVVTLATAYVPVFGAYAKVLFLLGAFAVLYSTFLVANAGHARTLTDCFKLFGWVAHNDERLHQRWVAGLGVALPIVCLAIYLPGLDPVQLVLLGGASQGILLPVLGVAALYFRYVKIDSRLRPGRFWDFCLIISCIGMLVAGLWSANSQLQELFKK